MKTPLVSVIILAYQHANYIKECLDSILMQKTNFDFEIIVGEDESTDGTRQICIDYANKYPDKIELHLRSRKNVIYINGSPTGRYNFIESLKAAKGKYIAISDGDDYWIDENKLQKQVDVFQKYPDCIICGGRTKTWIEEKSEFSVTTPSLEKKITCMTPVEFFYLKDWVKTTSRMVPKELMLKIPSDYLRDYRLVHYLLSTNPNGTFRCLNEVVAVYRQHAGGIYSGAHPVALLQIEFKSLQLIAKLYSDERAAFMKHILAAVSLKLYSSKEISLLKRMYYGSYYLFLLICRFFNKGINTKLN